MKHAIIEAIMLKKCYLQKIAEHCKEMKTDQELEEPNFYWGQVQALNWVLDLLGGSEDNLQWEFRDLCNRIYDIGKGKCDKDE